jgi:hypothetical protein
VREVTNSCRSELSRPRDFAKSTAPQRLQFYPPCDTNDRLGKFNAEPNIAFCIQFRGVHRCTPPIIRIVSKLLAALKHTTNRRIPRLVSCASTNPPASIILQNSLTKKPPEPPPNHHPLAIGACSTINAEIPDRRLPPRRHQLHPRPHVRRLHGNPSARHTRNV